MLLNVCEGAVYRDDGAVGADGRPQGLRRALVPLHIQVGRRYYRQMKGRLFYHIKNDQIDQQC